MIVRDHPLRQGTPPVWASEWGHDALGPWTAFEVAGVSQVMRWIPPGQFLMGSPDSDNRSADEGPQHWVTLNSGYWMFDTPCTQELWQAVTGNTESHFKGSKRPVENVSWDDCWQFIKAVNSLLPSLALRLPSEAEWEYACRAGTSSATYGELDTIAWYDKNSQNETHDVKLKQPNNWGLYDMLGNVWEWCTDPAFRPYMSEAASDPLYIQSDVAAANDVIRGGGWSNSARYARAAFRGATPSSRGSHLGFRCLSSVDVSALM